MTRLPIWMILIYRNLLSINMLPSCRLIPTCSEYAQQAISRHGFLAGSWMSLRRLCCCRPGGSFGYDPIR